MKSVQSFSAILLISLLIFSSGCNLFRQRPAAPAGNNGKAVNYSYYSESLGYQLEGNENPLLLMEVDAWLGVPYKYGGCTRKGTDCSCLIGNIYRTVYGVDLPRTSLGISEAAKKVSKNKLQEGDLIFFKTSGNNKVSHVGLHISKGYFVHASSSRGVMINHLTDSYYEKHYAFSGRIRKN